MKKNNNTEKRDLPFGKRLRRLRQARGLLQMDAAQKIGIGYKSLQNHEAGKWPNRNNFNKYIEFYQCNRDWLLTGSGSPFTGPLAPNLALEMLARTDRVSEPSPTYQTTTDSFGLLDKAIMVLKSDTALKIAMATTIEALYGVMCQQQEDDMSDTDLID